MLLPTPIDGEFIHIRALSSVKTPGKLDFLPMPIKKRIANFLSRLAAKGFLKDFLPEPENMGK